MSIPHFVQYLQRRLVANTVGGRWRTQGGHGREGDAPPQGPVNARGCTLARFQGVRWGKGRANTRNALDGPFSQLGAIGIPPLLPLAQLA